MDEDGVQEQGAAQASAARRVEREDVAHAYVLVLGRPPENDTVADGFLEMSVAQLLSIFFEGPEYREKVTAPLAALRRPPAGDLFDQPPPPEVRDWAAGAAPLTDEGRAAVAGALSWAELHYRLFADPAFDSVMGCRERVFTPEAWAALSRFGARPDLFSRQAVIEEAGPGLIRGWAFDAYAPARPVRLEVWSDGVLAGLVTADRFRRDVQDRLGGDGRAGFEAAVPDDGDRSGRPRRFDLRDPESGLVLASFQAAAPAPALAPYESVRCELQAVRAVLERLERDLPLLAATQGFALEDWAGYRDAFYASEGAAAIGPAEAAEITVLIDAAGATPGQVEDAVAAVARQRRPAWRVAVWGLDAQGRALLDDQRVRLRWSAGAELSPDDAPLAYADAAQAMAAANTPLVLAVPAGGTLAPDAIGRVLDAFPASAAALYVDEDQAEDDRHFGPLLKPAFDADLLRQTPYVGRCVAFRREVLAEVGLDPAAGPEAIADAVLRLPPDAEVTHLARVLFTRRSPRSAAADLWPRRVAAHLAGQDDLEVSPHADPLGAVVPGAARVRRSPPPGATAEIIIPTRDRLDLLAPCVDSILAHRADNRTPFRVTVVDHESSDPETLAYLEARAAAGDIRRDAYAGAFNWALINNQAAARSDADVLVFLNNDTVVLTPDWLDELCAQALRPDVGAVGARLLYADATLQHGGMVARGREAVFLAHEGVGAAGSDGGYLGRHALLRRTLAVTGACLAVARETFQAAGGFDSARLPVEGNDVDLCLRLQAAGFKTLYDPYATLYHLESKSRGFSLDGERRARSEDARAVVWRRWGEPFGRDPFYNAHFDREARPFARLRPPR